MDAPYTIMFMHSGSLLNLVTISLLAEHKIYCACTIDYCHSLLSYPDLHHVDTLQRRTGLAAGSPLAWRHYREMC